MKRIFALVFVVGLLLVGAFLTSLAARQGVLVRPQDVLSPEASVFIVTEQQKVWLVGIVVGLGVVTFGMGLVTAIMVRLLARGAQRATSEDADS